MIFRPYPSNPTIFLGELTYQGGLNHVLKGISQVHGLTQDLRDGLDFLKLFLILRIEAFLNLEIFQFIRYSIQD